jgi:dipeptidyl aminopeptidase/acylaminoacyl peptidase
MRQVVCGLALTLALGGYSAALADTPEGPNPLFTGRDLFSLRTAGDPQVRPDGGAIAYVRETTDIMTDRTRRSLWLIDARTGAETPLAADDKVQILTPRWSPDGTRLAYVAASGDGPPQLYVRWMATGQSARVATLEQAPNSIAWSPDGRFIAFTMLTLADGPGLGSAPAGRPEGAKWAEPLKVVDRVTFRADGEGNLKPGYSHLFVVAADGGVARQITFGKFDDNGPISWTHDGSAILFSANRNADWERDPEESEIFRVAASGGALTPLTHRKGPDAQPAVSPDGRLVAYLGFDDHLRGYENIRLYVMNPDGSDSRMLTGSLDRSVGSPTWAADGRSVYVGYADHGTSKIARVDLSGHIEPVAEGLVDGAELDRPYSGGSFSAGGGLVAYTGGDPQRPADLALAGKGGPRWLTHLNADLFATKTLAKVESLPVASSFDRKPIDAWIVTPPGFDPARKYPLILEIHGGPFASYGPVFSTDDQLYAAAGYIVVYANPRGSTSYGDAFANEIDRNYPSHDYDDLMSVVDAAIAKGSVDADHLYVTGGSGGGLLTAWIVGKTSRFKAAATQKPVINWSSEVLTTDGYTDMAKYWFGKLPWEDPAAYWARSPLSLVGNVVTPTLVVVGEEDNRTPPEEAEQYYAALQLRGVPTALVKVPGASHGGLAGRPSQSAAKASAILAWFARYK